MACMCGDICCNSCGPAQGNWRCPLCNAWASELCDHLEEYEGSVRVKPEFESQAQAVCDAEDAEVERQIAELEEAERLAAEEYREENPRGRTGGNPRQKWDDDGVDYGHPDEVREERLREDW